MEKYISGEDHNRRISSNNANKNQNNSKYVIGVVVAVLALAISFYAGVQYQKQHNTSLASARSRFGAFGGGHFGDRVIGTVTAISPTSISINSRMNNSVVTLSITSSTQISDNGQTVTSSDIKTGDTVFVSEDTSDTSQASRILVNPSFGGFGGGGSSSGSNTNSSSGSQTGSVVNQ